MSPLKKSAQRRIRDRERAEAVLKSLGEGSGDVDENYRTLYQLWCSNNSAVPELRPLFRIPEIEPEGTLTISEDFRRTVRSLASQILPLMSISKVSAR